MKEKNFEFGGLKKQRPLWQDLVIFIGIGLTVWGTTHVFFNRSAFGQIAEFKYEQLRASVIEGFEAAESEIKEAPSQEITALTKVEAKASPFRKKDLKPKNQAKQVFDDLRVYPSDNRLYIPRIGKNVPLISVPSHQNWQQLENNIQSGLREGVVVHPVSHAPTSFGNLFLTGHSSYYAWDNGRFKDVFALLHEVKVGDNVEVFWEGKKYVYRIQEEKVVPPTAVEVLHQPKDEFKLTLMTCTPVGTNKNRLILTGELRRQE